MTNANIVGYSPKLGPQQGPASGKFEGAKIYLLADLTTSGITGYATFPFDTTYFDTAAYAHTTELRIAKTGYYRVRAKVAASFGGSAYTPYLSLNIRVNNVAQQEDIRVAPSTVSFPITLTPAAELLGTLSAGDVVTAAVSFNHDITFAGITNSPFCYLSIEYVGDVPA